MKVGGDDAGERGGDSLENGAELGCKGKDREVENQEVVTELVGVQEWLTRSEKRTKQRG